MTEEPEIEPTDEELDEMDYVEEVDDEAELDEDQQSVDEYLDQMDKERMEYERIENDLYPMGEGGDAGHPVVSHKHTGDDQVQAWMAEQRRDNA